MYKKIESLGSNLLARFVPRVEAAAATCSSGYSEKYFPSCYQCPGGAACMACCRTGSGCNKVTVCFV
ncbi:hypothetical protein OG598_04540 [Micromonospora sp. NBC_00330]|uniref:hypothetical protein n=1 Tax=Micromonospora sp. NBC_00330 TaxID=2903585 RepID=UPI002E2D364A|nr:hypothetical protein [Micromonospora sp. NBC_00330]